MLYIHHLEWLYTICIGAGHAVSFPIAWTRARTQLTNALRVDDTLASSNAFKLLINLDLSGNQHFQSNFFKKMDNFE